jgi:hypothetical protein
MERFDSQHISQKASKFGIEIFDLFESSFGYVWSFLIYTGQDMEVTNQFVIVEILKTAVDAQFFLIHIELTCP